MPIRIFISHSSKDVPGVGAIQAQAEAMGIDVYLHEHDPQPGLPLAQKLKDALSSCDALLVMITANSLRSPYVNQEIGVAIGRSMPIVPIVEQGVSQDRLAMLQGVEYIEFDSEQPQAALTMLTAHLHAMDVRKGQKKQQEQLLLALAVLGLVLVFMYVSRGSDTTA